MKRSFYYSLSPEHQRELDRRLVESGFADYGEHQQWLASIGCTISKTQLSIYGAKFRDRFEDAEIQRGYERLYGEKLTPTQLMICRVAQLKDGSSASDMAKGFKSIDRMAKNLG